MDQERFLMKLECLITWIPNRPQNYCYTVGELDILLHFLHTVWAKCAGRERDLWQPGKNINAWPKGELDDSERLLLLRDNPPVLQELIGYWREVGLALGLRRSDEPWDDHAADFRIPEEDS